MNKKIFVSHSSADKEIVDSLVDDILIGSLGYNSNEIFYTSGEGMGIESGAKWRDFIKEEMLTVDVIILVITSNYKSSEICMNEMGASWTTNAKVVPIVIEPINYSSVGVLVEVNQVEKINTTTGLDNLFVFLTSIFPDVSTPHQARWTKQKNKFLSFVKEFLENNPFPEPISKGTVQKLQIKINKLTTINNSLNSDMKQMKEYIKALENKKDSEDINTARNESGLNTKLEEFEIICQNVGRTLNKIDSSIVTLVFNDYTKSNLEIEYYDYKRELEVAKAKKYIDEDWNILWGNTVIMKNIKEGLNKIKKYIEDLDEDNYLILEEAYGSLDLLNLSFWTDVINANIVA